MEQFCRFIAVRMCFAFTAEEKHLNDDTGALQNNCAHDAYYLNCKYSCMIVINFEFNTNAINSTHAKHSWNLKANSKILIHFN